MSALPGADTWSCALNAWNAGHLAMDAVWEAEIGPILWFQGLGDWLAHPFGAITELGSLTFTILLMAVVFWCVHPGTGARLFAVVVTSGVLNFLLKALFYGARPSWYSAHVTRHVAESSFGMPSGHAQNSTVLWGYLGVRSGRRAWLWAAAGLVLLICLSRIHLGAHFPSDVLVGVLLGAALLWAALRWEDRILAWWRGLDTPRWAGLAVAASVLPCVAATLWHHLVRGDWTVPAEWIGAVPTDPAGATLTDLYGVCGALLGGLVGFTLLVGRGWYGADGTLLSRAARFALGISGVLCVQVVLDVLTVRADGLAEAVASFAAYALIAFWASFGAPELFVRSGLAERPEAAGQGADENTERG